MDLQGFTNLKEAFLAMGLSVSKAEQAARGRDELPPMKLDTVAGMDELPPVAGYLKTVVGKDKKAKKGVVLKEVELREVTAIAKTIELSEVTPLLGGRNHE